jgi:hypothetical protein
MILLLIIMDFDLFRISYGSYGFRGLGPIPVVRKNSHTLVFNEGSSSLRI